MLSIEKSTFDDTRAIKVLVVPIGENSLFDSHFQTISVMRDTSVTGLTKPNSWTKENNQGFKHFDWSEGNLLFDYLRYDRVPNGPGDLDEFQSSRRVLMIMGLINYPELEGDNPAEKIQQELEYFTRRHPNVILRRLFLFNYPFQEGGGPGGKVDPYKELITPQLAGKVADPNLLVVFPPDLECAGGSMVKVHLGVNVENAAATIINTFGDQMRICENAAKKNVMPDAHYQIPLCTFFDEIEEREASRSQDQNGSSGSSSGRGLSSSGKSSSKTYKKKPAGRIRKWMGDLSMQTCSPRDALEHYTASIEVSRSIDDSMWLAGALEGYAAAILLAIKLHQPLGEALARDLKTLSAENSKTSDCSMVVKALMVAQERAAEALRLYSRSVVFCGLEVECALRVAKMQEMVGIDKSVHRWWGREQRALSYVLHSMSVPGLNTQQQVECTIEGALICKRLGLKKKYAFFLYVAAVMSAESDNMAMAHPLLRSACHQYGLKTTPLPRNNPGAALFAVDDGSILMGSSSGGSSISNSSSRVDMVVTDPTASWGCMRGQLLAHGAKAAQLAGDPKSSARFVSAMVRHMLTQAAAANASMAHWAQVYAPVPRSWHQELLPALRQARKSQLRSNMARYIGPSASSRQQQQHGGGNYNHDLSPTSGQGVMSPAARSHAPAAASVSPHQSPQRPRNAASSGGSSRSSSSSSSNNNGNSQVAGDIYAASGSLTSSSSSFQQQFKDSRDSSSTSSGGGVFGARAAAREALEGMQRSSFLSQISIGFSGGYSSTNSDPELLRNSYSASMLAMLNGPPGGPASVEFPSRSAGVEDIDLRCNHGSFSIDIHSFTSGAIASRADEYRNVALPVRLHSLGSNAPAAHHPDSTTGVGGDDISHNEVGDEDATSGAGGGWGGDSLDALESRKSFSSIYQESPRSSPRVSSVHAAGAASMTAIDANSGNGNGDDSRCWPLSFLSGEVVSHLSAMAGVSDQNRIVSEERHADAVAWLGKLSQDVAPSYAVALPELLVSLKPLPLPDGVRPVMLQAESVTKAKSAFDRVQALLKKRSKGASANANNNGGDIKDGNAVDADADADAGDEASAPRVGASLYYDPFREEEEKQREEQDYHDGEGGTTTGGVVRWAANSPCRVVALFYNPLSTPLRYSKVKLVLEGCAHITYATSVLIPARAQHYEVELAVLPLARGSLRVAGLEAHINAACYYFPVDAEGYAVSLPLRGSSSGVEESYRVHTYPRAALGTLAEQQVRRRVSHRADAFRGLFGDTSSSSTSSNDDHVHTASSSKRYISRGASTTVVSVESSGPSVAIEAAGSSTPSSTSQSRKLERPLHLHVGERHREWIRISSGNHACANAETDLSSSAVGITDLRVVATYYHDEEGEEEEKGFPSHHSSQSPPPAATPLSVKNKKKKKNDAGGANGGSGTDRGKRVVLMDLHGSLADPTATTITASVPSRNNDTSGAGETTVSIVAAGFTSADAPIAELGVPGVVAPLPLPLPLPLACTRDRVLCLQLEWRTHCQAAASVSTSSSVEISVELVGSSDPCSSAVRDLALLHGSEEEAVAGNGNLEGLDKARLLCEAYTNGGGGVLCRRGTLRVPLLSAPCLAARVFSLLSGSSTTTVLRLRNLSAAPIVVSDSPAGAAAEQGGGSSSSSSSALPPPPGAGSVSSNPNLQWVGAQSILLQLPIHSTRDLVLKSTTTTSSTSSSSSVPSLLYWHIPGSMRAGCLDIKT